MTPSKEEVGAALRWADSVKSMEPFEMEARLIKTLASALRQAEAKVAATRVQLEEIGNLVGGPTMTYSEGTEVREWRGRAKMISRMVITALAALSRPTAPEKKPCDRPDGHMGWYECDHHNPPKVRPPSPGKGE